MSSVQRTNLTRVFEANGVQLPDPDPALPVDAAVRLIAMAGRPELANCEIRGPEPRGDEVVYTLHRAVGTKGAQSPSRKPGRRAALAQVLAKIEGLRKASQSTLDTKPAIAVRALAQNDGESRLQLQSGSIPWLG